MSLRTPIPGSTPAPPAGIFRDDVLCRGCGYSLRGLPRAGKCPECGLPAIQTTAVPRKEDDHPLAAMPARIIGAFVRGCWLASLCVLAGVIVLVARHAFPGHETAARIALAVIAVAWVVAAIWLTPTFEIREAIERGFSQRSGLRRAARWLQLAWAVWAVFSLIELNAATMSADLLRVIHLGQALSFTAGLAGLIVLSIQLQRLAEWTRDDDAERRLNWAIWGVPAMSIVMLLLSLPGLMSLVIFGLWLWAWLMFPYGVLSLSKSVTLAALHSLEQRERLQRRADRQRQHEAELDRRIQDMDRG